MNTDSIVILNEQQGWGIYDTELKSYIGFKNPKSNSGKLKSVWHKAHHAKAAFKEHTGVLFRDQSKYIVVELLP